MMVIRFVDKTKGRTHYVFSLVGHPISARDDSSGANTYEFYLRRLRALLDFGTDETREKIARREQHILQEWLFKDTPLYAYAFNDDFANAQNKFRDTLDKMKLDTDVTIQKKYDNTLEFIDTPINYNMTSNMRCE